MDTALALVAAGMGVAILPQGVANRPGSAQGHQPVG